MKSDSVRKYKKLGGNIILFTLGNIGSKLITFLLVPLYTSALTTEQYGVTDLFFTLYNLIVPVVTVEIYFGLMRFSMEKNADHRQLFSGALYTNMLGLLVIVLSRPLFQRFDVIAPYFMLFVCYCFTNSMNNLLLYFARGVEHVRDYAIATILNTACVVTLNILFLLRFHWGIRGYLLAYTLSHLFAGLYLGIRLHIWTYIIAPQRLDRSLASAMMLFCIPLIPNTISWWISNQSDKFVIILFDGIAVSGVYAIAYKIPSVMSVLSNIFINAWQISSVEDFGSQASKSFFSGVYSKYISMQVLITSAVMMLSRFGAWILYKNDFFRAWHYVPLLALAVMFHAIGTFFASVYTGAKKTKGIGISTIIAALINLGLNFLLIPVLHEYGAALATLISYIVIVVVRIIHSRTFFSFYINFVRDVVSFVILIIQTVVASIELPFRFGINGLCLLLLAFLHRNTVMTGVKMLFRLPELVSKRVRTK